MKYSTVLTIDYLLPVIVRAVAGVLVWARQKTQGLAVAFVAGTWVTHWHKHKKKLTLTWDTLQDLNFWTLQILSSKWNEYTVTASLSLCVIMENYCTLQFIHIPIIIKWYRMTVEVFVSCRLIWVPCYSTVLLTIFILLQFMDNQYICDFNVMVRDVGWRSLATPSVTKLAGAFHCVCVLCSEVQHVLKHIQTEWTSFSCWVNEGRRKLRQTDSLMAVFYSKCLCGKLFQHWHLIKIAQCRIYSLRSK